MKVLCYRLFSIIIVVICASLLSPVTLRASGERVTAPIKKEIVQTPKIIQSGDTISYIVSRFIGAEDKSLKDILIKFPGIKVSGIGELFYNGSAIDRVYIEGSSVIGGRYGIILNNLSVNDIKTIEIIEKHQYINTLKGVSISDNAIINIRLNDRAKAKWTFNGDVNLGYYEHPLIALNTFTMRITKNYQNINTVKLNNVGENYYYEKNNFQWDPSQGKNSLENFFSVNTTNAPLLEKRVRMNNSIMVSTSNVIQLKNYISLSAQVTYLFDHLNSYYETQAVHYFADSTNVVFISDNSFTRTHNATAKFSVTANKPNYYVNDELKINLKSNTASSLLLGTYPNEQTSIIPEADIRNNILFIKKVPSGIININSSQQYVSKNQKLTVERYDLSDEIQNQNIYLEAFYTDTYILYKHKIKTGVSLSLKGGVETVNKRMDSQLDGIDTTGRKNNTIVKFENDNFSGYISPYINPSLSLTGKKVQFTLNIPVSYNWFWCIDKFTSTQLLKDNDLNIRGNLNVHFDFTSKFSGNIYCFVGNTKLSLGKMYNALILSNYRYMNSGNFNTRKSITSGAEARLSYSDPTHYLFVNSSFSYKRDYLANIQYQFFLGNYIINGDFNRENTATYLSGDISASKGIYAINGKAALSFSYRYSLLDRMRNTSIMTYSTSSYSVTTSFNGRPAKWIMLDYSLNYSNNSLKIKSSSPSDSPSKKNNINQILKFVITPLKNFMLELSGEHYFTQLSSDMNKNTFLLDASLEYAISSGIRLKLIAQNILNTDTFSYSTYSGLSAYSYEYDIRPLNITFGVYFLMK